MSRRGRVAGLVASVFFISTAALAEEPGPKWGAFLDIEGKVGTKRKLGEVTLFAPLWQDEATMLFGDLRFKIDDQNSHEGNFGLGLRRMMADGWIAGLYGFFDRRHSPNDNMFNQLTFGAEVLGTNFDFRANTYWPVGSTVQAVGQPTQGASTAAVSGGTLQVTTPAMLQRFEYALRGFDAEAGVRVPILPASGRIVTATLPGATISGTGTGGIGVVQVTDSTTLSGLTIVAASSSGSGVRGVGMNDTATNATITNNTITVTQTGANAAVGLSFGADNSATVSGNTITVTVPTGHDSDSEPRSERNYSEPRSERH